MNDPSLPTAQILAIQYRWLQGARNRLYKLVGINRHERVLDLGSGRGHAAAELVRRCSGMVVAFDRSETALHEDVYPSRTLRIVGNSVDLPFTASAFDLVFCQNALMWMQPLPEVISEIGRIIEPEGWLIAIEPDYGGYIEYPPNSALKDLWISSLLRAGAEPQVGRMLPHLLENEGFQVHIYLLDRLEQAGPDRLDLFHGLPLTTEEKPILDRAGSLMADMEGWQQLAHLPYFLIAARKY